MHILKIHNTARVFVCIISRVRVCVWAYSFPWGL
jgi:hypothetical protein